MFILDFSLQMAGFICISLVVLVSPWLFGAWEMWWFWPFAVLIFLATLIFALRLLLMGCVDDKGPDLKLRKRKTENAPITPTAIIFVLSAVPFLVYALICFLRAEVFMDAQRSFLLFLTPFLLAIHVTFGFSAAQRKALFTALAVNLCMLGLYGIINHLVDGSRLVLWEEGYPQYIRDSRATGSYFCPDHFSGIMELAFCLGLGLLLARGTGRRITLAGLAMLGIGAAGVVLSKSRGGGLTLLVVLAAALVWGVAQWRPARRWSWRAGAALALSLALLVLWHSETTYVNRFKSYIMPTSAEPATARQTAAAAWKQVQRAPRARMIAAALRAWKEYPVFGIGPGMHQNLWPHYAPTQDGNRELGVWPSRLNNDFHSYEVHSDWVQLLEEYGLVGFSLVLLPAFVLFTLLALGVRRERRRCAAATDTPTREEGQRHAMLLGALFSFVALVFHSLGDFNLQMPATTWLLAALLAIPLSELTRQDPAASAGRSRRSSSGRRRSSRRRRPTVPA